jgi:hypothetical protein
MGGTIGVDSFGADKGSEFWFTLPVKKENKKRGSQSTLSISEPPSPTSSQPHPSDSTTLDMSQRRPTRAEPSQNTVRVAYESSIEFVSGGIAAPFVAPYSDMAAAGLSQDMALLVMPNEGLQQSISVQLKRWGVHFVCGATLEQAEQGAADTNADRLQRGLNELPVTVIVADIDVVELSDSTLDEQDMRFILIASEPTRNGLGTDSHRYKRCSSYTFVLKPVRREALWRALLWHGKEDETVAAPGALSMSRRGSLIAGVASASAQVPDTPRARRWLVPAQAPIVPPLDARILLVEDNPINVQVGPEL